MTIEKPLASHLSPPLSKDVPQTVYTAPLSSQPSADLSAGALPPPSIASIHLQKWNSPRINIWRVAATFWSFIILGANDAAYGALIPYLEEWYSINYTVISLVFLSPIVGYTCSALLNNQIHMTFGQRGIAIIMGLAHLTAYVVISVHPPYPVLVIVFILAGFGSGLGDSAWNAWIGDMANPNEVLGFLHGFYGLGAAIAPLVATAVVTKAGWHWYEFYYLMVGGAVIETVFSTIAFWKSDGPAYRAQHAQTVNDDDDVESSGINTPTIDATVEAQDQNARSEKRRFFRKSTSQNPKKKTNNRTLEAIKSRVTWLVAGFLLLYVGIEVSVGGWLVTFMITVRQADNFSAGMTPTGFWLGITFGRLVLGFVTGRLFRSEKHAVATYLVISTALQLMFWLIPQFIVSSVMVSLLGFFLGPMFPAAVVTLTKLLPKELHVAAVGFAAALGASGACVMPFAVGAIANAKGVYVLQPIILAGLVCTTVVWLIIPTLPRQRKA